MRICHFSDSHLGAGEQYSRRGPDGLSLRQYDYVRSFKEAIAKIIELKPDLCVHSGDLFDSVRPTNRILAIAAAEFHRLAEQAGIPTVVILGNHDAPRQLHQGSALEVMSQIRNLHLAYRSSVEIFDIGDCAVYAVPHAIRTESVRELFTNLIVETPNRYKVLVTHGVVAGMPEFSMAELGEQEIPPETFANFDYVALGHFHNMRKVTERAWYAGATERLSQAERDSAKGLLEIALDNFAVHPHYVTAREMLDIHMTGQSGEQLVRELERVLENEQATEKIVRVTILNVTEETIRTIPTQAVAELRKQAFSLDVRFQRIDQSRKVHPVGRAGVGNLEDEFAEYIVSTDTAGFDRSRLLIKAREYLAPD